jgi:hypothetical protein
MRCRHFFAITFLWNDADVTLLAAHDEPCMEAEVTLLKPVRLGLIAASLIGIASLAPAEAQMAPPEQVVTNGPQANVEGQSPNWSARQNVIQSQRYDRLVATSSAFREARMRKECGPVTDPQLHESCVASFNQNNPG